MTTCVLSKISHSLKLSMVALCLFYGSNGAAKEYIVKLKYDVAPYDLKNMNEMSGSMFEVMDTQESLKLVRVNLLQNETSMDAISLLTDHFDAEYVVENVKLYAFNTVNDPRYAEQWALQMIEASEAWNVALGSHNVVVAVVDTGINLSHEDLRDNLWTNQKEIAGDNLDNDNNGYIDDLNGWDFHGKDKDPNDETSGQNPGHGTHCAGIVGAECNNGLGICGIARPISLMALRFLGSDGSGDLFAATKAIEYAAQNGAHIISASWGAAIDPSGAQPLVEAIKHAEEKGVIFVAAAGNDGHSNDTANTYPANAGTPHMISVAASNSSDQKPQWSNYGRKVDIAAPGENILSTIPGGYQNLSGTSMATPLVAGLVALMKSVDINLTGAEARSILQSTGKAVGIETASNKRIAANAALKAVSNRELTLVPAALTLKPGSEMDMSAWGGTAPYRFSSLHPSIATITEAGHLVAVSEGDAVIEVMDAEGKKASSVSIKIGNAPSGGGGSCPLPDQMMCMILCVITPNLPWCADMPGLPDLPFPFPPKK